MREFHGEEVNGEVVEIKQEVGEATPQRTLDAMYL